MEIKTCCFTGHRRLPPDKTDIIKKLTRLEIFRLFDDGYENFVCGGALGYDTLAALAVLDAKKIIPDIKLTLVLPSRQQTLGWRDTDVALYNEILSAADRVDYVSDIHTPSCMHERNRRLVESASVCVAYLTQNRGGSYYTVGYAKKRKLRVVNVAEHIEYYSNMRSDI